MTTVLKESKARRGNANSRVKRIMQMLVAPVAGVLLTVVLIEGSGHASLPTLMAGFDYALGGFDQIARTVAWGLPLVLVTIGVAIAMRTGMFSIGAEGQIYVGALVGALAGAFIGGFAPVVHQAITMLLAALAAGLISAGLGWLAVRWNVDVVLSSLLSNWVLMHFCIFLANGPFADPTTDVPGGTPQILPSARFELLIPKTQLTSGVFVVIVLAILVWWIVEKSVAGYRWRMIGESRGFARAVGIDVARWQIMSMGLSGALCGVGGAFLVMAAQYRFASEIAIGLGWIAIMLALIAKSRPALAIVWVLVYSIMRSASRRIEQVSEVPAELAVLVICVVLVMAMAAPQIVKSVSENWGRRRGVA